MTEQADNSRRPLRGLRRPATGGDAARLADLVRARFGLGPDWTVTVAELRCRVPGCPPVETVALMWDADGAPYRLRVFRPLAEVGESDLPPRWYLPALAATDDVHCGCC
jgi:nitrate reductase delta subunit